MTDMKCLASKRQQGAVYARTTQLRRKMEMIFGGNVPFTSVAALLVRRCKNATRAIIVGTTDPITVC